MEGQRDIDVLVAAHKKVDLVLPEYCRFIQVGSAIHEKIDGYLHDDSDLTGLGTISEKNESYCELTATYYLWKQSSAAIKGLYHYRRFFYNGKPLKTNMCRIRVRKKVAAKHILEESKILTYLKDNDVIVEIPYLPGTRTVRDDLELYCYKEDIDKLDNVIHDFFPEYYDTYESVMGEYHASYCNMLIAKKEIFDGYCKWLFDVLGKCEDVIDISEYDKEHKRIYGYFGEVLQNVYMRYHGVKVKYVPLMYIYEYLEPGRWPKPLDWIKTWLLQFLGALNISLPTGATPIMKTYNQDIEKS